MWENCADLLVYYYTCLIWFAAKTVSLFFLVCHNWIFEVGPGFWAVCIRFVTTLGCYHTWLDLDLRRLKTWPVPACSQSFSWAFFIVWQSAECCWGSVGVVVIPWCSWSTRMFMWIAYIKLISIWMPGPRVAKRTLHFRESKFVCQSF